MAVGHSMGSNRLRFRLLAGLVILLGGCPHLGDDATAERRGAPAVRAALGDTVPLSAVLAAFGVGSSG